MRAQVELGFVVEIRDQKAGVRHVDLELLLVDVPLQWELRELQAGADVDEDGVLQPLHTAHVVFGSRALRNLRILEFLVFFRELLYERSFLVLPLS